MNLVKLYNKKFSCFLVSIILLTSTLSIAQNYCTPFFYYPNYNNCWIKNVTFTGGVQNLENTNTGIGLNGYGYSDYTHLQHVIAPGSTVGFTVDLGDGDPQYGYWLRIYIDKDNNGFDADDTDDLFYIKDDNFISTFTDVLEQTQTLPVGSYRMRIITYWDYQGIGYNACSVDFAMGEAEDYTLLILPPCSGTPDISTTTLSIEPSTTAPGSTYQVKAENLPLFTGLTYFWEKLIDNTWTEVSTSSTYQHLNEVATMPIGTTIDYRLGIACGTNTIRTAPITFTTDYNYCTPSFSNSNTIVHIANAKFQLEDGTVLLDNSTSFGLQNGYSDYTVQQIVVAPQTDVDFSFSPVAANAYGFGAIWVDVNLDGQFDYSEKLYSNTEKKHTHTGTLSLSILNPGEYRMRVMYYDYENQGQPCVTSTNAGEIEDYTLVIQNSSQCAGKPNAGTAQAYPYIGQVGSNYIVYANDFSPNTGLSFTWQSSTDQGTTWTSHPTTSIYAHLIVPSAASPAGTQTLHRLIVGCLAQTDTSTITTFTSAQEQYCTPTLIDSDNKYIMEFHTSNAISDIHNVTNAKSPNGYGDFTTSHRVKVIPNMTFNFDVVLKNNYQTVTVWIDWNKNGVFEASEMVAYSTAMEMINTHSNSITVPDNQEPGLYVMRVLEYWGNGFEFGSCVETIGNKDGEIEEYTVEVLDVTPCSGPPNTGTLVIEQPTANPSNTYNVKSEGYSFNSGLSYIWYKSTDGGTTWNSVYSSNTYSHLNGEIAPAQIGDSVMYYLQVVCDIYKISSNVITFKTELTYCTPTFDLSSLNHITQAKFELADGTVLLENNSAQGLNHGYSDYTDQQIVVDYGTDIDFSLTSKYSSFAVIWIDLNQNGTFEDDEIKYTSESSLSPHSSTLALNTTPPGSYRMRCMVMAYKPDGQACIQTSWQGEAEDYTIVINHVSPCSGTPTIGTLVLSHGATANPGIIYTVTAENVPSESNLTFQWETSVNGGAWTPASNPSNIYHVLVGQIAPFDTSKVIEYRLTVACGTNPIVLSDVVQFQSSITYCIPEFGGQTWYISKIETTEGTINLNNESGLGTNGFGYSDYTTQQLVVEQGKNILFKMSVNDSYIPVAKVWIDVNKNGSFELAERYHYSDYTLTNFLPDSLMISNLPAGTYRMRFMYSFYDTEDACFVPGNTNAPGEAEDYTLVITNTTTCSGAPNTGSIILSQNTANPYELYSVIAIGFSINSGLSYIWEKSIDGGTNWTEEYNQTTYSNLNNQMAPPNIGDEVLYRLKIACGTDTSTSNTVTFKTAWTYCTPIFTQANQGVHITDVVTTGAITNLNNTNTSYGLNSNNGYSDYTAQIVEVAQGFNLEYSINIAEYPTAYGLRIAIDMNQNGQWDNEEILLNSGFPVKPNYSGTLNISSLQPGTYRMRIITFGYWALGMCPTDERGEAEDYTLVITPTTACSGIPSTGTIAVTPTITGATYTVFASGYSLNSGLSFIWEQSTDDTDAWTAVGEPTSYYVPLTIYPETIEGERKWRLKVACGQDTAISNVAIFTQPAIYCTPSTFYSDDYTAAFKTTGGSSQINYTATSQMGINGYYDLTNDAGQKVTQVAGQSFGFSHTYHNIGNYLAIWIDWNKNGIFENTERVFYGPNEPITQIGTIDIPMHISPGDYRMRVRSHRKTLPSGYGHMENPCYIYPYGQILDFTLTVDPMSDCAGTPSAGTIEISTTEVNVGSPYDITATGFSTNAGLTFIWEKSTDGGTSWNTHGTPSSFYTPLLGVTESNNVGDQVTWRLQVSCGTDSDVSNEVTLTSIKVYCVPEYYDSDEYIEQFVTSIAITNAYYVETQQTGTNGYNDLTDSTSQLISVYPGQSFNFSYTAYSIPNMEIWIDNNENGTFEDEEQVILHATGSGVFTPPLTGSGTITIPDTLQAGIYRMRVRTYGGSVYNLSNRACRKMGGGQALDFKLEVLPCNIDPGTIVEGDVSICQLGTIQLTNTQTNGTYSWSSDNETIAVVDATSGIVTGLKQGDAKIVYSVTDDYGCTANTSVIVTVVESIPVVFTVSPKLGGSQDTLFIGDEFDYLATPSGGTWTSLASVFATIDPVNGHAKALAVGQTTISYTEPSLCGNTSSRTLIVVDTIDNISPPDTTNSINDIYFVSNISLYPNPATDEVQLEFTLQNNMDIVVELTDLTGKTLHMVMANSKLGKNNIVIDVSAYASGVYSVVLQSEGLLTTKKLAICK